MYVNGSYRGDDSIGKLMHDFCAVNADEMYYGELIELVENLLRDGTLPIEKIAQLSDVPLEQVKSIAEKIS